MSYVAALDIMARLTPEKLARFDGQIAEMAKHTNDYCREYALKALAKLHPRRLKQHIKQISRPLSHPIDPSFFVREAALICLLRLGSRASTACGGQWVSLLTVATRDPTEALSNVAKENMERLPLPPQCVLELCGAQDADMRLYILRRIKAMPSELVAMLHDAQMVPLRSLQHDPDPRVSGLANELFEELFQPDGAAITNCARRFALFAVPPVVRRHPTEPASSPTHLEVPMPAMRSPSADSPQAKRVKRSL